jgi:hypothetical protein
MINLNAVIVLRSFLEFEHLMQDLVFHHRNKPYKRVDHRGQNRPWVEVFQTNDQHLINKCV